MFRKGDRVLYGKRQAIVVNIAGDVLDIFTDQLGCVLTKTTDPLLINLETAQEIECEATGNGD